jgi:hypothetical protein
MLHNGAKAQIRDHRSGKAAPHMQFSKRQAITETQAHAPDKRESQIALLWKHHVWSREAFESKEHEPAPAMIRKMRDMSMEKSVRASLIMNQNPWPGLDNSGILVVAIAVQMMINNGIEAMRTVNPIRTSKPQIISKVPTKCAVKYG